jgi:hypothetical protein
MIDQRIREKALEIFFDDLYEYDDFIVTTEKNDGGHEFVVIDIGKIYIDLDTLKAEIEEDDNDD